MLFRKFKVLIIVLVFGFYLSNIENTQAVSNNLPVIHTIMPGDRLQIIVEEEPDISRIYTVASDGTIDFPMIGRLRIAENSTIEAAEILTANLENSFFKKASVFISVSDFVEGSIHVLGAVQKPGSLAFKGDQNMTLLEAIAKSGGLLDEAAGSEVHIVRWKPGSGMERQVIAVDMLKMFNELDFSDDQFLRPRDIVVVPERQGGDQEYLVLGEVANPGFHPYIDGMDVIRAITAAGAVTRHSRLDAVRLLRGDGQDGYSAIPIDLTAMFGSADMSMNLPVKAGDIIFVPADTSDQATAGQVLLLGAVMRTGAIALPLNQEVTVARTILANGGFNEFANDNKVRIQRKAPNGSKQMLEVDVGRILKTGSFEDDVTLRDGDVILVPEKLLGF